MSQPRLSLSPKETILLMAGGIFALVGLVFLGVGIGVGLNKDSVHVQGGSVETFVLMFCLIGGLFALLGLGLMAGGVVNHLLDRRVRATGLMIEADIESVEQDLSTVVNGRRPYRIVCRWVDPETGLEHEFLSRPRLRNPAKAIEEGGYTTLAVRIDPKNPKRYFVDDTVLASAPPSNKELR
jgi:hypothetical protein